MARGKGDVFVSTFFSAVDRQVSEGKPQEQAYEEMRALFEGEDLKAIEGEVVLVKAWLKTQERASKGVVSFGKGKPPAPETLASVKALFPNHYDALVKGTLDKTMKDTILAAARAHAKVTPIVEPSLEQVIAHNAAE